jgi:hypothetical protein
MRRFAVALAFLLAFAAVTAGSAGSRTSKSAFEVFVEPTITAAANGLTLESELQGSFNVANKTADGSGAFSLMAGTTVLDSGTFTLNRLVAFQFYGCGEVTTPDGRITLPSNLCGGRAIFAVHAPGRRLPVKGSMGSTRSTARSTTRAARRRRGRARASRSTPGGSTSTSTLRATTCS